MILKKGKELFYFDIELPYQQESLIQPQIILSFCINGI